MNLRAMFAAIALASVCLVGCGEDKKGDEKKADASSKKPAPEPPETAKYEPFDAHEWRPDPGKANPDAWRPENSEATKATGSIFNALKNALQNDSPDEAKDSGPGTP